MTALIVLVAMMLMGNAWAVVNLDCSDNATCIEHMAKEIVRSLKQQKSVRVFDVLTIEPLNRRQARSTEGWLTRFMEGHAFSYDWNDYTFRISQPEDRSDVLDLEIYEGRTAKDVSDPNAKKSSSKAEEETEEDKGPHNKIKIRRRHKKKVMQMIIPLLFGMKSAGIAMFAFTMVSAITLKAFVASKLALFVTVGMAMKKLYETYGSGLPATTNVLSSIARYFKILFGFTSSPLNPAQTMTMPMYVMPQMYGAMPMTMPPMPMTQ